MPLCAIKNKIFSRMGLCASYSYIHEGNGVGRRGIEDAMLQYLLPFGWSTQEEFY
jgi:hypothetical protein